MTYVAAITAVLARYPEEIITAVTHPVTGLPSKKGWLPTVKEVTDACNEAVQPIAEQEARLKRISDQLAERERETRGERPTIEQLKAKYGEDWGLTLQETRKGPAFRAPTAEELSAHYREFNLEFQPKQQGQ